MDVGGGYLFPSLTINQKRESKREMDPVYDFCFGGNSFYFGSLSLFDSITLVNNHRQLINHNICRLIFNQSILFPPSPIPTQR